MNHKSVDHNSSSASRIQFQTLDSFKEPIRCIFKKPDPFKTLFIQNQRKKTCSSISTQNLLKKSYFSQWETKVTGIKESSSREQQLYNFIINFGLLKYSLFWQSYSRRPKTDPTENTKSDQQSEPKQQQNKSCNLLPSNTQKKRFFRIQLPKTIDSSLSSTLNPSNPTKKPKLVVPKITIEKSFLRLVTSKCFAILNGKQLVASRKPNKQREIASLTKIMTCYLVILLLTHSHQVCQMVEKHSIDTRNTHISISRKASQMQGTTADLKQGDRISLYDLLFALMLPSGNDAALALAEYFGKMVCTSQEPEKFCSSSLAIRCFVEEMNSVAKDLQLTGTNFANSHGLANSKNISTAQDIAILVQHAMLNQLFRNVVQCQVHKCMLENEQQAGLQREVTWETTNRLLTRKDCIGVKTGVTPTAGPCLAVNFSDSDIKQDIIIVLLKTVGLEERFTEASVLYEQTKKNLNEYLRK